jgi:hypothetical protein
MTTLLVITCAFLASSAILAIYKMFEVNTASTVLRKIDEVIMCVALLAVYMFAIGSLFN